MYLLNLIQQSKPILYPGAIYCTLKQLHLEMPCMEEQNSLQKFTKPLFTYSFPLSHLILFTVGLGLKKTFAFTFQQPYLSETQEIINGRGKVAFTRKNFPKKSDIRFSVIRSHRFSTSFPRASSYSWCTLFCSSTNITKRKGCRKHNFFQHFVARMTQFTMPNFTISFNLFGNIFLNRE